MLFYTALFLFCVAISVTIVWLIRSLSSARTTAYRAILPSSRTRMLASKAVHTKRAGSPRPRGWSQKGAAAKARRAGKGASLGDRPVVGWPYREETSLPGGREFRVVKKSGAKSGTRQPAKPWGW